MLRPLITHDSSTCSLEPLCKLAGVSRPGGSTCSPRSIPAAITWALFWGLVLQLQVYSGQWLSPPIEMAWNTIAWNNHELIDPPRARWRLWMKGVG
ncbi:MAG: hypothetical protein RMJ19_14135 [Gemmatales bacterium]|nr:hypothetical protein [Gemmatales bacterium]MDW8176810.1 hypothetical protein [Gemmatales bacterium]